MAVCARSHQASEISQRSQSAFANQIVSTGGLIKLTASAVWGPGQHQIHVLVQSRPRLQLLQVFQRIEESILDKAALSHG